MWYNNYVPKESSTSLCFDFLGKYFKEDEHMKEMFSRKRKPPVARDPDGNAIDPAIRRREEFWGTIANVALVITLVVFMMTSYIPPRTPEAYHDRLSRVGYVPGAAEAIKESIRPVADDAIPEGYILIDDFVVTSARTPDLYFVEYWMLIQDPTGNQEVIICDVPDNWDALLYWEYVRGSFDTLPAVQLTHDGENYHLSIPEGDRAMDTFESLY